MAANKSSHSLINSGDCNNNPQIGVNYLNQNLTQPYLDEGRLRLLNSVDKRIRTGENTRQQSLSFETPNFYFNGSPYAQRNYVMSPPDGQLESTRCMPNQRRPIAAQGGLLQPIKPSMSNGMLESAMRNSNSLVNNGVVCLNNGIVFRPVNLSMSSGMAESAIHNGNGTGCPIHGFVHEKEAAHKVQVHSLHSVNPSVSNGMAESASNNGNLLVNNGIVCSNHGLVFHPVNLSMSSGMAESAIPIGALLTNNRTVCPNHGIVFRPVNLSMSSGMAESAIPKSALQTNNGTGCLIPSSVHKNEAAHRIQVGLLHTVNPSMSNGIAESAMHNGVLITNNGAVSPSCRIMQEKDAAQPPSKQSRLIEGSKDFPAVNCNNYIYELPISSNVGYDTGQLGRRTSPPSVVSKNPLRVHSFSDLMKPRSRQETEPDSRVASAVGNFTAGQRNQQFHPTHIDRNQQPTPTFNFPRHAHAQQNVVRSCERPSAVQVGSLHPVNSATSNEIAESAKLNITLLMDDEKAHPNFSAAPVKEELLPLSKKRKLPETPVSSHPQLQELPICNNCRPDSDQSVITTSSPDSEQKISQMVIDVEKGSEVSEHDNGNGNSGQKLLNISKNHLGYITRQENEEVLRPLKKQKLEETASITTERCITAAIPSHLSRPVSVLQSQQFPEFPKIASSPVIEGHGSDSEENLQVESSFTSSQNLPDSGQKETEPEIPRCSSASEDVLPVKSKSDLVKQSSQNLPATGRKETELKSTRCASLINFFTAKQIKEHISSLRKETGQGVLEEANKVADNDNGKENQCQLCGADKLLLENVPIYCSSCNRRVEHTAVYYSTPQENGTQHFFCCKCYTKKKIVLNGNDIPKEKLEKKNHEEIEESWVQCDKCKKWQHQICALYNDKKDEDGKAEFICPNCYLEEMDNGKHVPVPNTHFFNAKNLRTTKLSNYIEQRLFERLQQERQDTARYTGVDLDEVPGAEDLVVRVVASIDKKLKVKQQFLDVFHGDKYPSEFSYRSKAILLFQKIDGLDVCIFAMYVQEYGSDCSHPNQRCVYISYLDSVKYFRPNRCTATGEALRTFVYHEILIAYLAYVKQRGFVACHLWSCPPGNGDDYILNCHPPTQKTPNKGKLCKWYLNMMQKAKDASIVVDISNAHHEFFGEHSKITAAQLPYFEGDYFSGYVESLIPEIEKKNGKPSDMPTNNPRQKSMGHTKDILLMKKLGKKIDRENKKNFIVVHLQYSCSHCRRAILSGSAWVCSQCKYFQLCERCHDVEKKKNGGDIHVEGNRRRHTLTKIAVEDVPFDTEDGDLNIDNSLFETPFSFLSFCQKNYYQFNMLRRAKYSSTIILDHLCSNFHEDTVTKEDRNTCVSNEKNDVEDAPPQGSYEPNGVKEVEEDPKQGIPDTNTGNSQPKPLKKQIKNLLKVIKHTSKCLASKKNRCFDKNCAKMKWFLDHPRNCKIGFDGKCRDCDFFIFVNVVHSKNCANTDCCLPFCKDKEAIRKVPAQKIKQLQSSIKQKFEATAIDVITTN